jgi:hypothetical protein
LPLEHSEFEFSLRANVRFASNAVGYSPKADIAERRRHVRFVPKADVLRCGKLTCDGVSELPKDF